MTTLVVKTLAVIASGSWVPVPTPDPRRCATRSSTTTASRTRTRHRCARRSRPGMPMTVPVRAATARSPGCALRRCSSPVEHRFDLSRRVRLGDDERSRPYVGGRRSTSTPTCAAPSRAAICAASVAAHVILPHHRQSTNSDRPNLDVPLGYGLMPTFASPRGRAMDGHGRQLIRQTRAVATSAAAPASCEFDIAKRPLRPTLASMLQMRRGQLATTTRATGSTTSTATCRLRRWWWAGSRGGAAPGVSASCGRAT